jgi:hypothetical protein
MSAYDSSWNPYNLDAYGRVALGAVSNSRAAAILATPRDPIFQFGTVGAKTIMQQARRLPPAERKAFMEAVLGALDPTLHGKASQKAKTLVRDKRMSSAAALEKAIAVGMANGLASETLKRVQGKVSATGYVDMAGFWSRAKRAVTAPARGAKAVGRSAKKAGQAVGRAAKKAGKAAVDTLKKVGKLACAALNSGLVDQALAAALPATIALSTSKSGGQIVGEASGEKVAGAAASMGRQLCSGSQTPEPVVEASSSMTVPIVAGGGLLALLLLL